MRSREDRNQVRQLARKLILKKNVFSMEQIKSENRQKPFWGTFDFGIGQLSAESEVVGQNIWPDLRTILSFDFQGPME